MLLFFKRNQKTLFLFWNHELIIAYFFKKEIAVQSQFNTTAVYQFTNFFLNGTLL